MGPRLRRSRRLLPTIVLVTLALLAVACGAGSSSSGGAPDASGTPTTPAPSATTPTASPTPSPTARPRPVPTLPHGGRRVFAGNRFLVAYYGTARTGSLGVLGEFTPDEMQRRLARAAAPFGGPHRPVQPVYELIVTVVDPVAGKDGNYNHDIDRAEVERYIRVAHRHGALLLLDLQPGREGFFDVARRWEWALKDPWVGLALDPEWRMGPRQIPARTIGSVGAPEVDRTATWLARLTHRERLPQKLFVLHQFRPSMIRDIRRVRPHPELAMVQHVDGFGTQGQKLGTYHAVARPSQFRMGFKLFYDEDIDRMGPAEVHRIRPTVRFISFQ